MFDLKCRSSARSGGAGKQTGQAGEHPVRDAWGAVALAVWLLLYLPSGSAAWAQSPVAGAPSKPAAQSIRQLSDAPPRVTEARRFLTQRGWTPGHRLSARSRVAVRPGAVLSSTSAGAAARSQSAGGIVSSNSWQALGPTAVLTANFGLVTGRVASIALDPSDTTGNRLYLGTTGGGVWMANNAGVSTTSSIVFTPLTDAVAALGGASDASISIGALTVQPGVTGVILAGTGDPNDVLDSYYGAGILRSTDNGNTWSLIQQTQDLEDGLGAFDFTFIGQGFAGFAWSTVNPEIVVAAVSQAYEGTLVDADWPTTTYEGLYYSTDSGATWHLATITDGSNVVQSPLGPIAAPGNAATAVVWNPVRQLFLAAVRYHGYYQSPDGVTWTRLTDQPGSGLTKTMCPNNLGRTGSVACPIYRGALAVNPTTGDTFAWTVDQNDQDQGLWQDLCEIGSGACGNSSIAFSQQWDTTALETSTSEGAATIADGNYNLTLAAIPSGQETMVLAGAHDLWKTTCPVSQGCTWRNTTNSTTCMSAQVAEFQHSLAWNTSNPLEVFVGNDSGLWRSVDAIGETGPACSSTDSSHFQNLNGSLGSLAEAVSLSPVAASPYTLMAGLGVNGTAGVKSNSVTTDWPQILSGYGGPVAIDPNNSNNWYVNDQAGVGIYLCAQSSACTASDFGTGPAVDDADVSGDGSEMPTPAPFLVDPLDTSQLLIGTCRVWRGPADNSSDWSTSNAISSILDSGAGAFPCNGNGLIRSMAAMPLASGGEIIYAGMYGSADNGGNAAGHVFKATFDPSSGTSPTWTDLTLNSVVNDTHTLNYYGLDISSVTIDPHDTTGNTVYVTVAGMESSEAEIQTVYRSTNGGATWTDITANLPEAPVNNLAVDPQNANTVYLATDLGVYFTTQATNCAESLSNCWSVFGSGLPAAPAVALSAAPATAFAQVLVAATYGRGLWQTPLWSAGTSLTTAVASPASLAFSSQVFDTSSSPLAVTLENTGSLVLSPTSISITGDFSETDDCMNESIAAGASCTIEVTFTPQATGSRSGEMTIYANVDGGQLTVDLAGTGAPAGAVSLTPSTLGFGDVEVRTASTPLQVTAANSSSSAIAISSVTITSPFVIASNSCGTTSLAANSDCALQIEFEPATAGTFTGLLTFTDGAGTQTVVLSGTGESAPTDALSATSLSFPATAEDQLSAAQSVTITNTGGEPLTSISIAASSQFQESSTCGTQLAPGVVCTISVQFAPTQVGAVTGTLTVADILRTQPVSLSGTGLAPAAFSVSPTSMTFTNQQPGVASSPQMLTVTNSGGASMANIGFAFTGSAASSYSVTSTTCGSSLASGSSCTAQIVFTPSATGSISAALVISSSTSGVAAASVPLNGSGQLATGLATNPSQITFPVVAAGQSSTAQPVTVTNSSSYAIGSVALAATASFSVRQNTCTGSLAAGAACTASVIFQPTGGGSASGLLTVSSSEVATPATVALSGTGFDFTVGVTGLSSQTVVSGQQADYTLVISPVGASGTFAFACGTLPSNALCLFNPTSETLSAGVQGNIKVEVSTGGSSTARLQKPGPGRPAFWRTLPLACGLLLLPLALKRRRRVFLLLVLAAVLAGGVSSCTSSGGGSGGGSSGESGSPGTAAGTYTIPVSVTSTGITQSVNLTLTVD